MIEQAINETLLLLTRQYRDIKEELETAKRIFIKENTQTVIFVKYNFFNYNSSKNESWHYFSFYFAIFQHKIPAKSESDWIKDDEVCFISEPESGSYSEPKLGSEHVSGTERYNREVISDLVQETLSPLYYERMRRNNSYEPGVSSW